MRHRAAADAGIEWRDGTAEATGLPAGSTGLVLCAQAFHWFRQPEAVAEFHRVLRPRGRLALMWNRRDRDDPLTRGFVEAIHAVNGEHPAEKREFDPDVVHETGAFTVARHRFFGHAQELDAAGLIGRARSASYVPKEGAGFATLERMLTALHERHRDARGRVQLRYRTIVWLAERR
jgi:SAM-dependent methyltransferase